MRLPADWKKPLADDVVFAHVAPGGHLDELRQLVADWQAPHRVLG